MHFNIKKHSPLRAHPEKRTPKKNTLSKLQTTSSQLKVVSSLTTNQPTNHKCFCSSFLLAFCPRFKPCVLLSTHLLIGAGSVPGRLKASASKSAFRACDELRAKALGLYERGRGIVLEGLYRQYVV